MYDRHLDAFIGAAELGSFSKAGEAAHISANAVIKQVNLLEAEVGAPLFERTNRGVVLTEAGRIVYRGAKEIIALSERTVREAREAAAGLRRVRVGTSIMRPCTRLVGLWSQVAADHPDVQLEIVPFSDEAGGWEALLGSLGATIDVVAGVYPSTVEAHGCRAVKLSDEPVRIAVSRRNPLATRDRLAIEELRGQELIVIRRGDTSYIDAVRDKLEREHPQVRIRDVEAYDAGAFNLCESRCCAMLTIDAWADVNPALATIPADWDFTIPYGIMHPVQPTPAVSEFVEAMLEKSL